MIDTDTEHVLDLVADAVLQHPVLKQFRVAIHATIAHDIRAEVARRLAVTDTNEPQAA